MLRLPVRDSRTAYAVALSPDGQNVYVTAWGSDAVVVLAPGPTVSALRSTARGLLSVRVTCPALHAGDCAGRMTFSPAAPLRRLTQSTTYRLPPGRTGVVHLRLSQPVMRALAKRKTLAATIDAADASRNLAPTRRAFVLRHRAAPTGARPTPRR